MTRVTGVSAKALTLVIAGTLLLSAGCKKEEEVVTDTPAPPPLLSASAAAVGANTLDVATYPAMTPQRGTRRLLQPIIAFQAADMTSKEVARLDPGTILTVKATYGNWMMVSWQNPGGQLTLGWVDLKMTDGRAALVSESSTIVDAGAPRTDAGVLDAGAPVVVADAGAPVVVADAGTKPADAGTTPADAGTASDAGVIRKKIVLPLTKK